MKALFRAVVLAAALPSLAFAQGVKHPTLVQPASPPELGVVQGVQDYSVVRARGSNADCDATEETIWSSGAVYTWITTADELRIKSGGNAADAYAGNGAREIVVEGLDASWDPISERIQTQGTAASIKTTQQFLRLNRAYVRLAGTYTAANTAAITIETEAGTTVGIIPTEAGTSDFAGYSVPDGFTAYVAGVATSTTVAGTITIQKRIAADDVAAPLTGELTELILQTPAVYTYAPLRSMIALPARSDVWMTCGTGTNMFVTGVLDIYLVPDKSALNATPTPTPIPSPTPSPSPTP